MIKVLINEATFTPTIMPLVLLFKAILKEFKMSNIKNMIYIKTLDNLTLSTSQKFNNVITKIESSKIPTLI